MSAHRTPIIRWLGNNTQVRSSSSPSPSPPPSPSLNLLNEALSEDILPAHPPQAHLPPSFYVSRSLSRPPSFLDNLARSTLPTASLSSFQSTHIDTPVRSSTQLSLPSPDKSSLDTLRSLRDRGAVSRGTSSPTRGWWFQSENKENVDTLLTEEDRGRTVQEEQDAIHRKYRAPKNPVVFCHGLLGFDSVTIGPAIAPVQVTHWRGIKEVLEANGTEVLITRVPATSSPVDRAKVLEQKISEVYPGRSVHLIGHSMGGLDCRYLTTHLTHRKFRVLSLTTIATPHRGSSFADHFLSTIGKTRMPSVLSLLDLLPNGGGDGKAFESLTIESMRRFNEETPDVDGVRYFSWGAVYEPGFVDTWKWPHSIILEKEGPNDGLVSVSSSKWGTYLGTLTSVNHLDLVGWINTARYKWAEMMGKEIQFRPATFYLGIGDMLANEVEGEEGESAESRERPRGELFKYKFKSSALGGLYANFNLFLRANAVQGKVPVLIYLAGLECTEDHGTQKSFIRDASSEGIALLFPDTSSRGAGIDGEDDDWQFGTAAGFYLDATNPKYADHYKMLTHITLELPQVIEAAGLPIDFQRQSVFGHSMGGVGALTLYLASKSKQYRSASAFSPISNPTKCPWGEKAFKGYLQGGVEEAKERYDATELIARHKDPVHILIDYGTEDKFYKQRQLLPENFLKTAREIGYDEVQVRVRRHEGYDHSYYFISTFSSDHIHFHAGFLKA